MSQKALNYVKSLDRSTQAVLLAVAALEVLMWRAGRDTMGMLTVLVSGVLLAQTTECLTSGKPCKSIAWLYVVLVYYTLLQTYNA